jgi:hypothetical protein
MSCLIMGYVQELGKSGFRVYFAVDRINRITITPLLDVTDFSCTSLRTDEGYGVR